jgi:hypothetical protein
VCIEAKSRKNAILNDIFRLFASIHGLSLNQGSVFLLRKCQIRIPRMFLGVISRKFSKKIFLKQKTTLFDTTLPKTWPHKLDEIIQICRKDIEYFESRRFLKDPNEYCSWEPNNLHNPHIKTISMPINT